MSNANNIASSFKALHQPGNPLILANVWDILSARTVAALPSCKALATASFAVARTTGIDDDELTLDQNLNAVRDIVIVAKEFKKPLTVDFQDGYGSRLKKGVESLIELGVSGINLEDYDRGTRKLFSRSEAVSRIELALRTAESQGVPDFVVNARIDTLLHGGTLEETLQRGKVYLAAGATTVFVLRHDLPRDDVAQMLETFGGMLNVSFNPSSTSDMSIKEIANIGVARISVGPMVQFMAMETVKKEAEKIMTGTQ